MQIVLHIGGGRVVMERELREKLGNNPDVSKACVSRLRSRIRRRRRCGHPALLSPPHSSNITYFPVFLTYLPLLRALSRSLDRRRPRRLRLLRDQTLTQRLGKGGRGDPYAYELTPRGLEMLTVFQAATVPGGGGAAAAAAAGGAGPSAAATAAAAAEASAAGSAVYDDAVAAMDDSAE